MMRADANAKGLVRGIFRKFSLVRNSASSAFTRQKSQVRSL